MLHCLNVHLNNLLINYKEKTATVLWRSVGDIILTGQSKFARDTVTSRASRYNAQRKAARRVSSFSAEKKNKNEKDREIISY